MDLSCRSCPESRAPARKAGFRLVSVMLAAAALWIGTSCEKEGTYDPGFGRVMPGIDLYPAWNPDGSAIAFRHIGVVSIDYDKKLYEIDPDSAGIRLVGPDGSGKRMLLPSAIEAAWSPDGRWLAVTRGAHIWKIKADGDSLTQLTFEGKNFSPAWSPDGEWIAYDCNLISSGGYAIWLMRPDGKDARLLVSGRFADWHPDGGRLVSRGLVPDVGGGIVRYDLNDGTRTLLFDTGERGIIRYVRYSPDGGKIAFNWSDHRVWVMESDGYNPRRLSSGSGVGGMSWSPDGAHIVYAAEKGLWIADSDGGNPRQLTFPPE